jgi:hypothetical protein
LIPNIGLLHGCIIPSTKPGARPSEIGDCIPAIFEVLGEVCVASALLIVLIVNLLTRKVGTCQAVHLELIASLVDTYTGMPDVLGRP